MHETAEIMIEGSLIFNLEKKNNGFIWIKDFWEQQQKGEGWSF